ncbi:hypothetical protein AZI86_17495 [Bdellovibrio bacteriovorus]|uniref:DUF4340 domain-containing protein n=1 Tax=Bdellovibrio bacteriovorus TaxID=959 RepID=A0A150WEZ8_BDEBC|nr:DUF4340 domain-containing protein [Bdellovibrio bacteriovorus]KYG61503.1 hypothetical protein AZI86_17495 [Bdellovibrio bacteriovorus]
MKLKGRTILVLCLLVFGGYAAFDHFQGKLQEDKKMQDSRLMTLNFEQVNEVLIEKGDQKTELKRDVDGWRMEVPLKDSADSEAVDDLVKQAFTESIVEVVKEGEGIDWKLYGLDAPLGTITFKTTDGKQNRYEVSSITNFEDNAFLRRDGENRVLLVNSIWQARTGKAAMEFRDRRLLRHKIASVDEIKLQNAKGLVHLKRQEGVWVIPGKSDFKVDQNQVRSVLTAIADAKAAEILSDPKKGPAVKELFTLNLVLDAKPWAAKVGQAADKKIFAKVTEPDFLMKMEPGAVDNFIEMTIEQFKEKPPEKPQFETEKTQKKEN